MIQHDSRCMRDFSAALAAALPREPRPVVVNSSLMNLMPPPEFEPRDMLSPFGELSRRGWTFAFAAFTFQFCRTGLYHARESKSETGLLADWVWAARPDAVRLQNPIYSYVVIGPQAEEFLAACSARTAFGDAGPFGVFERIDALQMGLGCVAFSQLHRDEQVMGVPYRYMKTFRGKADWCDGRGFSAVDIDMYVRDLEIGGGPVNQVDSVMDLLKRRGRLLQTPLWRNTVFTVSTRDMATAAREMLTEDPFALLTPESAGRVRRHFGPA